MNPDSPTPSSSPTAKSTEERLADLEHYLAQPPSGSPASSTETITGTIVHTPLGAFSVPHLTPTHCLLGGIALLAAGALLWYAIRSTRTGRR